MHDDYGRNGLFGMRNFQTRTLSTSDISAIRSKYGVAESDAKCCTGISGTISLPGIKGQGGTQIWIEDAPGRVAGSAVSSDDGSFSINGLSPGRYKVFAKNSGSGDVAYPPQLVSEVSIDSTTAAIVTKRLESGSSAISVQYLGLNGQLSDVALPLTAGRETTILIGGRGLNPKTVTANFNSPFLVPVDGSVAAEDYGNGLTVISLRVAVSAKAPIGDYSIYINSGEHARAVVVGGLAIERP